MAYNGSMPRTGMTAEEIRNKAIESTVARMRQHGFEKVRLVDIAKDLGVSHAALYSHFSDKAALLDAVSEQWLARLDEELEKVCHGKKPPLARIYEWFLTLHLAKRNRVRDDPELYKAFNSASEVSKPFVKQHLKNMDRQVTELVKELMADKAIRKDSPQKIAEILFETTTAFHHPRLVAQHLDEKRESLLRLTLDVVFKGLR
jgi:AcrR family transcriptional regulator